MNKSLAIFGGSYLLSLKQPTLAQAGTAPSGPAGGAPGFEAAKGASLFADKCAAVGAELADRCLDRLVRRHIVERSARLRENTNLFYANESVRIAGLGVDIPRSDDFAAAITNLRER
jgi:hypothetical protein